ncbi:DegT/DnrJ/EryC1/StrS family aminotransferase [Planctomycetota bacterium]
MIGVGTFKTTKRTQDYVQQVLASGRLSYGPFTQKFERVFAAAHDCRFAVMTCSGTCALLIALAALKNRYKWNDGDEVIVPAVTFIATSNVVIQLNLKPVFVDVDPLYYELDPDKIAASITARTRCIIPVHLFGLPCDMDRILEIARRHELRVVEDSCETMFTGLGGRPVGSFGDIACFSTYVAHLLCTGVGGLCTTNDPQLAVDLRSLMNHGRDSIYISMDDDQGKTSEELSLIIRRRFSFVQLGYSFRVTELEGAIGLAEFEMREDTLRRRRENAANYIEGLKPFTEHIQLPTIRPATSHAFMMFPIVLRSEPKSRLVEYLEQHGIETRDMMPLINQPVYRDLFDLEEDDFPVAKWINHNGFYIGCHHGITETECQYVVDVVSGYFAERALKKSKNCLVVMSKGDGQAAKLVYESLPTTLFDDLILVEASADNAVPEFFCEHGFTALRERGGKGDLLTKAVDRTQCENIVVLGLDGADDPDDIMRLLIKLRQGSDVVIASRFMPGGGRRTTRVLSYRSLGNRFFSFLLSVLFGCNISDCNNLFRAFKKGSFHRMGLREKGESIMFEMTVKAFENGMRLAEVPTVERPSPGTRKKRNRILSAISFLFILLAYVLRAATMRGASNGQ